MTLQRTAFAKRSGRSLLAIGCGLRILFFFFSRNNGGDAFARVSVTANWLQHPSFNLDFGGPRWPPLHFWLMALVAQVVPNVILAGRLLSLAAGLASLWLFWRLVSLLYGDWPGTISLAVLTFYSLHIAYSTTSSSEETFVAFVLGGLLGVFAFRNSGNYYALIAGGLSLTGAGAIRFEAWIVIFSVGLIFLLGQQGRRFPETGYWKTLLVYCVSGGVWPIFWSIHSWLLSGHALNGLADNRASIPAQLSMAPAHQTLYELMLTPGVIILTLTPFAVLGSIYTLWLSVRNRKHIDFAFMVVFFAVIQLSTIAAQGTLALSRYTLMLGTLCAALAGYGLAELGDKAFGPVRVRTLAVLSAIMVANLALIVGLSEHRGALEDKFRSISPLMQFPVHVEEVGRILQPQIQPTDRVLIDNYNDEPNILGVAIGLPVLAKDRAFYAYSQYGSDPFPYLNSQHPRFAILSEKGTMGSHLAMPHSCWVPWQIRGMEFRCVFENDIYRAYKIEYAPATDKLIPAASKSF